MYTHQSPSGTAASGGRTYHMYMYVCIQIYLLYVYTPVAFWHGSERRTHTVQVVAVWALIAQNHFVLPVARLAHRTHHVRRRFGYLCADPPPANHHTLGPISLSRGLNHCFQVHLYVCMRVCMYVSCMHACMYVDRSVDSVALITAFKFTYMYVCMYVCKYVCMYVCMRANQ